MPFRFVPWDVVLVVVVTAQATALAYLRHPQLKAFVLSLPIPFTIASLAVGRPIGITNVVGLVVLFLYTQGVRLLHVRLRLPIIPAIALSALGYCLTAATLAPLLPQSDLAFWVAAAGTTVLGALLYQLLPARDEPGYRTALPVWIKGPAVAGVICLLVFIKSVLQGFMTVFPMVGVVAAYESRHSLWTIGRQIPVCMMTMAPMMMACRLVQPGFGLGPGLAAGWVVLLALLIPIARAMWAAEDAAVPHAELGPFQEGTTACTK